MASIKKPAEKFCRLFLWYQLSLLGNSDFLGLYFAAQHIAHVNTDNSRLLNIVFYHKFIRCRIWEYDSKAIVIYRRLIYSIRIYFSAVYIEKVNSFHFILR